MQLQRAARPYLEIFLVSVFPSHFFALCASLSGDHAWCRFMLSTLVEHCH